VLLGHEAAGGKRDAALDASIGVELLHAYLLIHDDFMDQDDVRRGGPTLHRALGGDHLGASLALLCGSLCEAWAYELLGTAAPLAARTVQQVIAGQMADVRAPVRRELSPAPCPRRRCPRGPGHNRVHGGPVGKIDRDAQRVRDACCRHAVGRKTNDWVLSTLSLLVDRQVGRLRRRGA